MNINDGLYGMNTDNRRPQMANFYNRSVNNGDSSSNKKKNNNVRIKYQKFGSPLSVELFNGIKVTPVTRCLLSFYDTGNGAMFEEFLVGKELKYNRSKTREKHEDGNINSNGVKYEIILDYDSKRLENLKEIRKTAESLNVQVKEYQSLSVIFNHETSQKNWVFNGAMVMTSYPEKFNDEPVDMRHYCLPFVVNLEAFEDLPEDQSPHNMYNSLNKDDKKSIENIYMMDSFEDKFAVNLSLRDKFTVLGYVVDVVNDDDTFGGYYESVHVQTVIQNNEFVGFRIFTSSKEPKEFLIDDLASLVVKGIPTKTVESFYKGSLKNAIDNVGKVWINRFLTNENDEGSENKDTDVVESENVDTDVDVVESVEVESESEESCVEMEVEDVQG